MDTNEPTDPGAEAFTFQNQHAVVFELGAFSDDLTWQDQRANAEAAVGNWDDIDDSLAVQYGGLGGTDTLSAYDGVNSIFWVDSGMNASQWGLTTFTYVDSGSYRGMIVDADIRLNDASFEWTTSSHECTWSDTVETHAHIESIVTHELGHALGIGHSTLDTQNCPSSHGGQGFCPSAGGGCESDTEALGLVSLASPDSSAYRFLYTGLGTVSVRLLHAPSQAYNLPTGWSLMSVPLVPPNDSLLTLIPPAVSAFVWRGSYQQVWRLPPGPGYWVNMGDSTFTGSIHGDAPLFQIDSTFTSSGWHVIGSPSVPVDTSAFIRDPAGMMTSLFEWAGGYHQVGHVEPGKGYWLNLNATGRMIIRVPVASFGGAKPVAVAEASPRSAVWAQSGGARLEIPLGVPADAVVAWPPVPPHESVFDFRAIVGGIGAGQIPASADTMEYALRVQGVQVDLGLELLPGEQDVWQLLVNGTVQAVDGGGSVSVGASDQVVVRQSPDPQAFRRVPTVAEVGVSNYPNPFNASTAIRYTLTQPQHVELAVYDLTGQALARLVDEPLPAGPHQVTWEGRDGEGQQLANGVYLLRLRAGPVYATRKMLLVK